MSPQKPIVANPLDGPFGPEQRQLRLHEVGIGWVGSGDELRLSQRIPKYVGVAQVRPHALA